MNEAVLMALVQAPVGATQERTLESIAALENHFLQNEKDAVDSVFSVQGFSFAGMGQNAGMAFVKLKDWSERDADNGVMPITGRAMAALGQIKDAFNTQPSFQFGVFRWAERNAQFLPRGWRLCNLVKNATAVADLPKVLDVI